MLTCYHSKVPIGESTLHFVPVLGAFYENVAFCDFILGTSMVCPILSLSSSLYLFIFSKIKARQQVLSDHSSGNMLAVGLGPRRHSVYD